MAEEADLILALEFITEGARAVVPQQLQQEAFALESFQKEMEKIRKKSRGWTMGRSIQGLGIGRKITKGREEETLAMRVYVDRKKARAKCKNPVPKTVSVPEVGKVPTDVVEIGRVEAETFRDRVRPAMPGAGLGHKDVTVGTFGCLVRRRGRKRRVYILSNSHVLANSGLARIGDTIIQPGDRDGGRVSRDTIATLSEFVRFDFGAGFPNLVDAAVARVNPRSVMPEIRILGVRPAGVSRALARGMAVKKVGRTTDFTTGVIQDLHYRVRIPYRISKTNPRTRRAAGFKGLVLCSRYTAAGDSGAVVLNSRDRAVGLHIAGSQSSSIFCRIQNVFDALNIELV